jgi:hypothetical protein
MSMSPWASARTKAKSECLHDQDITIMNWTVGRNTANRGGSEKGKHICRAQSNSGPASSNASSGSQV